MKFDIALGVHNKTENYYINSLVTLLSALSRAGEPVGARVLHDHTLDRDERENFAELAAFYNCEISFHALDAELSQWPMPEAINAFSPGCLFRLFIPSLFPDKKVLYLDSDTIMAADPCALFASAAMAGEKAIWAARDDFAMREDFKSHIAELGLQPQNYFNSGVLLFNNPALHGLYPDFLEKIRQLMANNRKLLKFPDQDALNLFFSGKNEMGFLSAKYNFQIGCGQRSKLAPEKLAGKVVHYTWRKPWDILFPAGTLYWREWEKLKQFFDTGQISC